MTDAGTVDAWWVFVVVYALLFVGQRLYRARSWRPPEWPDGKVTGLRARGGFIIDIEWRNGALEEARAKSLAGRPLHFRWHSRQFDRKPQSGETVLWDARQADREPVAD